MTKNNDQNKKSDVALCGLIMKTKNKNILIDPRLSADENNFINSQTEILLSYANELLLKYPPKIPEPEQRRSALLLLDAVFHELYAPHRPAVQLFFKSRTKKAIDEIEHTQVTNGARIWKLYNHAFVIKTKDVTIGFDLTRAESVNVENFLINKNDMIKI